MSQIGNIQYTICLPRTRDKNALTSVQVLGKETRAVIVILPISPFPGTSALVTNSWVTLRDEWPVGLREPEIVITFAAFQMASAVRGVRGGERQLSQSG